ncbi:CdaR family protein [Faecalicatena orotica]|uniref:CdaR family protein n=1 Tax=Faecalicatena orotica TaxID=1544 RepID=UPI003217750A
MKKYKFTNNLGLKIMALVFAALLWLIVVNVDDPVETATFRNVPVTMQNVQLVTNDGHTYRVLDDTESVSVIVKAKRSVLAKITVSNIVANADMAEMQFETLVPITPTIPGYEGKYTAEAVPGNLKVKVEKRILRTLPLTVSVSGTPRDGHVIGDITTNPDKVQVRGSESLVNSIDKAVAKVDVSGISKTGVLPAELEYYDSSGNVVGRSQLTDNIGEEGVTVNVTVLDTKNLALNFNVTGTPEDGYVFSGLTCEPEKIQVCGTKEALAEISSLDITDDALDISGATGKFEKTVDILPYLPEGIELVDETANNIIVTVKIEQIDARTIELPVESIRVDNLKDNLLISYESETEIEMQFKGPQDVLKKLDMEDAVSIDMKNHTKPGKYDVQVSVTLPDDIKNEVKLTKRPVIKVTVTEKEEQTEPSEPKEEQ